MKIVLFLFVALSIGCVSKTIQTDAFLRENSFAATEKTIDQVPFIEQSAGHCGPATLAMAINWAGLPVSVEQISKQVFTPGMKGSLQTDMISAARRNGLLAIPITGIESLMKELSAGNPVIVFENLALRWLPQWHYAIVFGYDLEKQTVLMHSGPESFKHWDIRKFERSWMLGEYWGLVVLPTDKLSASAGELAQVKAAAALEQLKFIVGAKKSYQNILKRWPQSLGAAIGLANIAFADGESGEAAHLLEQAIKYHPQASVAWHNLAIAQGTLKRKKSAKKSSERAIELATESNKIIYKQTLRAWLDQ